jgi:hypothetical protein
MKISLLHKSFKDNKKESPLFVRVRGKTSRTRMDTQKYNYLV